MGLEVWFVQNVQDHVVAATVMAITTYVANGQGNPEYLRGCLDMGRSLSIAHGVQWAEVLEGVRESLMPIHREVLEENLAPSLTAKAQTCYTEAGS